jgi:hypothetical protein
MAAPALNVPVNPAAIAKRNNTKPVASLTRLSPSRSVVTRAGSGNPLRTAFAATASGGETMAPKAKQEAQGRDGMTR